MLITAYFQIFDPKVTSCLVTRLGPYAKPSAQRDLNVQYLDSNLMLQTNELVSPEYAVIKNPNKYIMTTKNNIFDLRDSTRFGALSNF